MQLNKILNMLMCGPKKPPTTIERYVYVKSMLTYIILSIGRTAVHILAGEKTSTQQMLKPE